MDAKDKPQNAGIKLGSYVTFNGVTYEFTDKLLDEVLQEIEAKGVRKEDIQEEELPDLFTEALEKVLTKKQNPY